MSYNGILLSKKQNALLIYAATQMNLKNILSERRQTDQTTLKIYACQYVAILSLFKHFV